MLGRNPAGWEPPQGHRCRSREAWSHEASAADAWRRMGECRVGLIPPQIWPIRRRPVERHGRVATLHVVRPQMLSPRTDLGDHRQRQPSAVPCPSANTASFVSASTQSNRRSTVNGKIAVPRHEHSEYIACSSKTGRSMSHPSATLMLRPHQGEMKCTNRIGQ